VCGCMEIVCLQEVTWNPIFHVAAFHKLFYYYLELLLLVVGDCGMHNLLFTCFQNQPNLLHEKVE
jgi:hypothetical protein